jgi:Tfp pilus assembly protein PilZ
MNVRKGHMTLPIISNPILVISYNADIRAALSDNLQRNNAAGVTCESFLEAEDVARGGVYNGILVDLQSIVKAKGDEKIIACSLTGFYPTLRVRALGSMLVPMAMPGDARQDSSLSDFITKTCAAFNPRRLRLHRRRDMVLSAVNSIEDSGDRLFTINMSWGGAFVADVHPEKYEIGQNLRLSFPEFERTCSAIVSWIRPWGQRKVPGIGIAFQELDEEMESILNVLLKHDRNNDRDRMIAR